MVIAEMLATALGLAAAAKAASGVGKAAGGSHQLCLIVLTMTNQLFALMLFDSGAKSNSGMTIGFRVDLKS